MIYIPFIYIFHVSALSTFFYKVYKNFSSHEKVLRNMCPCVECGNDIYTLEDIYISIILYGILLVI